MRVNIRGGDLVGKFYGYIGGDGVRGSSCGCNDNIYRDCFWIMEFFIVVERCPGWRGKSLICAYMYVCMYVYIYLFVQMIIFSKGWGKGGRSGGENEPIAFRILL